jgi:predicted transcriptional regulator
MTLDELRLECGLSKLELARQAGIDFSTLQRAITGVPVLVNTASRIARAISKALGKTVRYQDIDGLNIKM